MQPMSEVYGISKEMLGSVDKLRLIDGSIGEVIDRPA
jgi:hypothetical protein